MRQHPKIVLMVGPEQSRRYGAYRVWRAMIVLPLSVGAFLDRRKFIKLAGAVAAGVLPTAKASVGASGRRIPDAPVYQWQPTEFRFKAVHRYDKPWSQVDLSADFAGPDGQTFHVHGFWDGGDTWALRFSPTQAGKWSYRVECNVDDAGLKDHAGAFNVLPATDGNSLYRHGGFLRVAQDHHYLTYSDGKPFFWLGDTWWFCPSSLVPFNHSDHAGIPSMYKALVDKRKSQGFTIAQMAFLGSLGAHQDVGAFMSLLHGGSFDMAYWHRVDGYIQYANNAGIIPAVVLEWYNALPTYTLEQWKFLWRYFIARYGAHAVTWLITGEYNSPHVNIAEVLALGAYIKACDPYKRAMSVYPWWYARDKHQAWSRSWYDFIMLQGAHAGGPGTVPPTDIYTQGWNYGKPVIEGEARYEHLLEFTADDVRRTAWHAIQAGCCGYTYGANGLWYPTQGPSDTKFWKHWGKSQPWWVAMNYPGAQQMTYMKNFYESIAWWKTRPLPGAVIMHGALDDAHQPLARSENNDRYVIWFPQGGDAKAGASLKLLDGQGQDHYHALWFNPRSGKTESLVQTLIAARGICILPKRPDGYDWVLLLTRTHGVVVRRHQGFYDRAARRPESPDGISAAIVR